VADRKMRERKAAHATTNPGEKESFGLLVQLLESFDLRCGKCGEWLQATHAKERTLEYGTNVGGILLLDAFYIVTEVSTCKCGHRMSQRDLGTEELPNSF
jgi:hypothetical protein